MLQVWQLYVPGGDALGPLSLERDLDRLEPREDSLWISGLLRTGGESRRTYLRGGEI